MTRGFTWRLAPLQRKLEWEADAARAGVARELAAQEAARLVVRDAGTRLDQASTEARLSVAAHPDPRSHRLLLDHLLRTRALLDDAERQEHQAGERLAQARDDLVCRQRSLDTVLRAREDALNAHLREQGRREQAQADAGWLALREFRRDVGPAGEPA